MRVYLDNCCYNRPYDDQSQLRISLESQAKMAVQDKIRNRDIELATSYISFYENDENPYEMRRQNIRDFQNSHAVIHVSDKANDKVQTLAAEIEKNGVKHKDACHVACAILSECDYFLTTDDRLLKYRTEKIEIMNPIDFINVIED